MTNNVGYYITNKHGVYFLRPHIELVITNKVGYHIYNTRLEFSPPGRSTSHSDPYKSTQIWLVMSNKVGYYNI